MQPRLNKKLAFALGIICFALTLIWQAPASLLSSAILERSSGRILLTQAQGSIWNGKANIAVSSSSVGQAQVGALHWEAFPHKLLLGQLYMEFSFNQSSPALVTLSLSGLNIEQLNLTIPASTITHFVPSLNAAQLGGQLQLSSEKLFINKTAIEGNAQIAWQQANSPLSPVNPLGEYQVSLSGLGNILNIQLNTVNGALKLEGSGSLSQSAGLKFQGSASAQKEHLVALTPLLHMIGNEDVAGSGQYRFTL